MPIYEYICSSCQHPFTHFARTLGDIAKKCPHCGAAKPVKQFSQFTASVAHSSNSCSSCPATAGCPMAGASGCGGSCPIGG